MTISTKPPQGDESQQGGEKLSEEDAKGREKADDARTAALRELAGELGVLAADLWYEGKLDLGQLDDGADHLWNTYVSFWRFMQREKIEVLYAGSTPDGERGTFCPNDDTPVPCPPAITVTRDSYTSPPTEPSRERVDGMKPDLLDELVTLAHEYGHFVSWKSGNRTAELVAAGDRLFRRRGGDLREPCLDASQHALVLQEEERAWSYGKQALKGTTFEWWPAFDQRKREDLGHYEEMLRLDAESKWEPYVERAQDGDDLSEEEAEGLAIEEERAKGAR